MGVADAALAKVVAQQLLEECMEMTEHQGFQLPSTPRHLPLQQVVWSLHQGVQKYFSNNLQGMQWTLASTELANGDLQVPSMEFGGMFLRYHNMHSQGRRDEADAALTRIRGQVQPLVECEDSRLLLYFLEPIACCRATGHNELANCVIWWFTNQARLRGTQHSQTVIFATLLNGNRKVQDALMEKLLLDMSPLYRELLKPPHDMETASFLLTGSMIFKHLGFYNSANQFLGWLQPMYQGFYGASSWQMVQCRVDMAHVHIANNQLDRALSLIQQARTCCGRVEERDKLGESRIRYYICFATLCKAQGDLRQAEQLLYRGIEAGQEAALGDEHWATGHVAARHAEVVQELLMVEVATMEFEE